MTRKVYDYWGKTLNDGRKPLPPNVAYIDIPDGSYIGCKPDRKLVTWEEVLQQRKEKQKSELERKRITDKSEIKPCYVWVFYNRYFPFSGWYCYIKAFKDSWALNFRDERKDLQLKVMQIYPCGELPIVENFYSWMQSFQKHYPFNGKRKKEGIAICRAKISNDRLIDIMRYATGDVMIDVINKEGELTDETIVNYTWNP
jgi:hypothetical protein